MQRRWMTALVVVAGLGITGLAAWTVNGFLARAEMAEASAAADHATAAVRLALDRAALAARAVRAMYASDVVTNDQFVRFAQTLATSQAVSALGFNRRVENDDRAGYERGLLTGPGATLGIWENDAQGRPVRAPERPVYYVVESVLLPGGAQPPFGLDVSSLGDRGDSIRRAMDRFQMSVTGEISLSTLLATGIVIYDPVVDRQSRPIGVATATLTHADLLRTAAQTAGVTALNLAIGDPGSATATAAESPPSTLHASASHSFPFADRQITVSVMTASTGSVRIAVDLLILALGLAATAAVIAGMMNRAKTAELHIAEGRLRAMLDGLGPIALLLSPSGAVINANRAAVTTFHRSETEMARHPFEELLATGDAEDRERLHAAIVAAGRGEDVRFDMKLESPEGRQVFDLWIRRKELTGNLVASAVDVTDRYEAEETQRLLMRELDHRMKNTLQVIQAIIRRTATSQETIAKFEAALLGRIGAMSRAHDLLAAERWHGADLTAVVRLETEHLGAGRGIVTGGPHVRLSPKAALSFALVIHELGTNAMKYGALSTPAGKVQISWDVDRSGNEPELVLRWRESDGPPVAPSTRRGFGSLLIERSIAYELDGSAEVDHRPEGVVCTIRAPLRTVRSVLAQPSFASVAAQ